MHTVALKRPKKHVAQNDPGQEARKLTRSFDWRTTDQDEIELRRQRAREEQPSIRNLDPAWPIFSRFEVNSKSGMTYSVEVRSLAGRTFSCTCTDFRVNGLGTCKHIEAVLPYLEARFPKLFAEALEKGSDRIDVVWDDRLDTLRIENPADRKPVALSEFFDGDGLLLLNHDAEEVVEILSRLDIPPVRISQEVPYHLELRRRRAERVVLRREYEERVQAGIYPQHETKVPLFPYQREGMLHLAFNERALLADEMGLGKTIQAIAACTLLHRMGKAEKTLVVTPASLKAEWEEQIQRFSGLSYRLVFGPHRERLRALEHPAYFTIDNYEQMVRDTLDVNRLLRPDIVVLDEAERIKNWNTKTAQAIKRLQSRYAFVLTGTPIENRIDEIYSIVDFLDPTVFGPLFRFNREFYQLSARGRPEEYQNLELLRERVRPLMLRRRKADVETELPARMDRNLFVALSHQQLETYRDHEAVVARLVQLAKRRPLTQQEQERLIRELSMMRMVCDTFLSTDSGGVGLNLQNASVVINCDLPWNPAKLEQRIARAWRKNQLRAVTVINLISENTIEHRILGTLAAKQSLADGVLDAIGNLNEVKLQRKGQTFFERLELMLGPRIHLKAPPPPPFAPPADPAEAFARHAAQLLGSVRPCHI
jgi:SNF2 family DNA or RNA helicase